MEKRTVLAIVLSSLVLFAFFTFQNMNAPAPEPAQTGRQEEAAPPVTTPVLAETSPITIEDDLFLRLQEEDGPVPYQRVIIETDILQVELSNAGGNIVSYRLKQHFDFGDPVEMIFTGNNNESEAFAVAFGGLENVIGGRVQPDRRNFHVRQVSDLIVEFSQIFLLPGGEQFTMLKRYEFQPSEYMFELTVALDGGHSMNSFNFNGAAYTLIFSPQIGPKFDKLDQRYEYRRYHTYRGRLNTERVNDRGPTVITNQPSWAAVAGKYFTLAALPYLNQFELAFSTHSTEGVPDSSHLYITRPAANTSRIEDRYHFYLGPKNEQNLSIYERGDNNFRLMNTGLVALSDTRGFLAPLERGLKWLLTMFYGFIPNYGVAILLVTLVVRLIMFPLTKKGSEASIRMQALSPKIKEIQERNKGNPQKLNAEMADFYKKEGYNPLSGCLPMLLQMPIFFAMYNLFNSHFELRGAMFIPVWIPDLSRPESIYDFPNDFSLPLLGWTAIRLLPFIYVASQMLYGKVIQTPTQQGSGAQMKMMMYAMPIIFFFVLYDVPSGLLIYWITSNVLTLVQQVILNKYMKHKKALAGEPEAKPVIAQQAKSGPKISPKKKKKNR
ncbi:MAG: membrane protein insertase YidC [Treponema sp.]|nr:membrane protein insertase YidC [Treponema sp.]